MLQLHAPTEEELKASLADPSNPESTQEEWAEFTHIPDMRNGFDTAKDYTGLPLNPAQRKRFFDFDGSSARTPARCWCSIAKSSLDDEIGSQPVTVRCQRLRVEIALVVVDPITVRASHDAKLTHRFSSMTLASKDDPGIGRIGDTRA